MCCSELWYKTPEVSSRDPLRTGSCLVFPSNGPWGNLSVYLRTGRRLRRRAEIQRGWLWKMCCVVVVVGNKRRVRRGRGDEERTGCVGGKFGSRPLTLFGVGTPGPPVIDVLVRLRAFFLSVCSASAALSPANSPPLQMFPRYFIFISVALFSY